MYSGHFVPAIDCGVILMFQKFIQNQNPSRLRGMRIATLGLLVVIFGFSVQLINVVLLDKIQGVKTVAYGVCCVGMLIGFSGVIIHFFTMLFKRK